MEKEESFGLTVIYAANALAELDEIWDWNEEFYSANHADQYVAFLQRHIDKLGEDHQRGQSLSFRSELRYIFIRRRSKGYGHVAVYRVDQERVNVLHVFHSAQDWRTKLKEELDEE